MNDQEEKKPFTVRDRRRINLDEEDRTDATTPAPETPAPATVATATEAAEPTAPGAPAEPPRRTTAPGAPRLKVDFSGFIASLAAQAATLLGDDEHQEEGEAATREIIAILEMLQDKTEGRRTPDETQLLESVLFQLRMYFVNRGGTGGKS